MAQAGLGQRLPLLGHSADCHRLCLRHSDVSFYLEPSFLNIISKKMAAS